MKLSLKNKFLLPALAIIVLGMGSFGYLAFTKAKNAFIRTIEEEIDLVAQTTVTGMSDWFRDRQVDIENWSRQRLYRTALQPTMLAETAREYAGFQLRKIREDYGYYENIVLADTAGIVQAYAGRGFPNAADLLEQPFFSEALAGRSHVSAQATQSPATGRQVFVISSPVQDHKGIHGVLYGVLKADDLIRRFIHPIHIGEQGYAFVFKKDGSILAHSARSKALGPNIRIHGFGMKMAGQGEGTLAYRFEGHAMTAVFKTFDRIGWTVVVCVQNTEILAPVREMRNLFISVSLVIVVFVALAIAGIANSVNQPIKALVAGLEQMGRGNLGFRIKPVSNDEIADIGHAMNQMAGNLERSQAEIRANALALKNARDELEQKVRERTRDLRAAEEKYRSIFENAIEGIFRIRADGSVIHANPAMARILGFDTPGDVAVFNESLFSPPSGFKRLMTQAGKDGEVIGFETRIRRWNATSRWCSVSLRQISGAPAGEEAGHGPSCYDGLVLDIHERFEIERAQKEKEAALAASRLKSEFLANMSHEIRTPLNAVIGFCGLLTTQTRDPRQQSYINAIKSAGDNLLTLINDILDLSKMEAGKLQIFPTALNIKSLVEEVALIYEPAVREKKLGFNIQVHQDFPGLLMLDEIRIRQILVNLVGNAVKFTNHGHVNIILESGPAGGGTEDDGGTGTGPDKERRYDIRICVEDTGIGIEKPALEKIFQSFEQGDPEIKEMYGGTGLGLPICRRLVDAMGGEIKVSSTPGSGSRFRVLLRDVPIGEGDGIETAPLPVDPAAAGPALPVPEPGALPPGFRTILHTEIMPWFRSLNEALVVNEVLAFGHRLESISAAHNAPYFLKFARDLIYFAESFDIEMIQKKLDELGAMNL